MKKAKSVYRFIAIIMMALMVFAAILVPTTETASAATVNQTTISLTKVPGLVTPTVNAVQPITTSGFTIETTDSWINIREKASTSSKVITCIKTKGTTFTAVECVNGFYKLKGGKYSGCYISCDWTRVKGSFYTFTTEKDLIVRQTCAKSGKALSYLKANTTYTCTAIKNNYAYLKEAKGWCHISYLKNGKAPTTGNKKENENPPKNSTLAISKGRFPSGTLTQGNYFSFSGSITSNYKITSVTVAIYNAAGTKCYQSKTVNPNSTTYNIASIDNYIKFGTLSASDYKFCVTVKDASGKTKTAESSFTVKKPTVDKNAQSIANKVYERQGASECILTSLAMTVKGRLLVEGKSYGSITKATIRNWNGGGVYINNWNTLINNINKKSGTTGKLKTEYLSGNSASSNKNKIINLLKSHPEGVVLYFYMNGSNQHAVKFCNYDSASGTFYVSDPGSTDMKYVKMQNSLLGNGYYSWESANNAWNYVNRVIYY